MNDANVISQWLNAGKSESTQRVYRRIVAALVEWLSVSSVDSLRDLTQSDIEAFLGWRCDGRIGSAARNQIVACIRSLFSYCCEIGYFSFNPAASLGAVLPDDISRSGVLRPSDVVAAIKAEPLGKHADLLALTFGTGATVSEICCVKKSDIVSLVPFCFAVGKNSRVIACSASMVSCLSAQPSNAGKDEFLIAPGVSYLTGWRWLRDSFARVGVDRGNGQWLRASSAVHMRENGASWDYIANQLGCSPLYAMNTYGSLCQPPDQDFSFALSL